MKGIIQMQLNNLSRKMFEEIRIAHQAKRCGNRNVMEYQGKKWCVAIRDDKGQVRQFYEDCDGLLTGGEWYDKSQLIFGNVTRITPSGIKAYNVAIKKEQTNATTT